MKTYRVPHVSLVLLFALDVLEAAFLENVLFVPSRRATVVFKCATLAIAPQGKKTHYFPPLSFSYFLTN
jgi:hypothetical protein